jgi:hypothetical protein
MKLELREMSTSQKMFGKLMMMFDSGHPDVISITTNQKHIKHINIY